VTTALGLFWEKVFSWLKARIPLILQIFYESIAKKFINKKKILNNIINLPITKLYFLYEIYPKSIRVKVYIKLDTCCGTLLMERISKINTFNK